MCTALHCGLNGDEAAARTRDSTLDEQQVGLGIDFLNLQVLGGHAVVAHTASHALALEDAAWGSSATDTTNAAVSGLVTVSCALTLEAVALHSTSVAVALGLAGDVNESDAFEDVYLDLLADLVCGGVVHADFRNMTTRGYAGLLEVTTLRLVCLAWVNLAEGDLDGAVAIGFGGANLGDNAWPCLDDGNRYNAVCLLYTSDAADDAPRV